MPIPARLAAGVAVVALALAAAGPAPGLDLNPFSAIKSAVEAAAEDRGSGDIAKDLEIKAKIKAKITADVIGEMGTDVISISADVYEQDVMLTGSVETAAQKAEAGKLTRAIEDVTEVTNRAKVRAKEE